MLKIFPYLYQRHVFKKLSSRFSFILFALFFLYSLIDYSIHMQDFLDGNKIKFIKLIGYYGCEFIKRTELLIPLSFLIACIHTLIRMNTAKELVALQASGISFNNIFKPLWVLAACLCILQLGNQEYLLPKARAYLDNFKYKHIKSVKRSKTVAPFYILHLSDGSKFFYLQKDEGKGIYFDAIWLRSLDEVWRMKSLTKTSQGYNGNFIDVIKRKETGTMEKSDFFPSILIETLDLDSASIYKTAIPSENLSLKALAKELGIKNSPYYSKYEIRAELLSKILSSLLPLLVLALIAPFCIVYRRQTPTFVIFAISIFSFLAFKTLIDALKIMGTNNILSTSAALGIPYLTAFLIAFKLYYKKVYTR